MPNPTLIAATQNNAAIAAANTSATVASNGSVTAGNLQIVMVLVSGAVAPTGITPPDGTWTTFLATTTTEISGAVSAAIFYKKAAASGAFSGSFSWTTASTGGEWSFTEWSGCGAGLVDGTVGTSQTSGTAPASPAKTPGAGNVNDTLVCAIFGGVLSTSTVAAPAGMSSILTVNGSATQPLFGLASLNLASASATAAQAWTLGTGQNVLAVSFLLQQGPVWGFDGGGSGQGNAVAMPAMPPTRQRVSATKGKSEFAIYYPFLPMGWEVQPPPPPHPTPERRAAGIMRGDDGTEFTEINFVPQGWSVQHVQPPHRAPEVKFAALARGDDGNQFPKINFVDYGWPTFTPQPPHPTPEKRAAGIMRGEDGNEFPKINFVSHGWPILHPQPPHPRPERFGAIVTDDDGTESPFTLWRNFGWQVAPHQPQHPRPERGGSILAGEAGIEAKFNPPSTAPPFFDAWSHVQRAPQRLLSATRGRADFAIFAALASWVDVQAMMTRRTPPRSVAGGSEVAAALVVASAAPWFETQPPTIRQTLSRASAAGGASEFASFTMLPWWETPQPQPNHPRVERAGAIMIGDAGMQAKFIPPPVFISWGYEPTFAYPRPRWERSGGIARGDDGTEGTLIRFFTPGWEVQPPQPPHPRPERAGALMRGDDGVEAKFSFVAPILTWAYDQANQHARRFARAVPTWDDGIALPFSAYRQLIEPTWPQPPHPRLERIAALARGDDGAQAALPRSFPMGWEVQPVQPPHPRPERFGGLVPGDSLGLWPFFTVFPQLVEEGRLELRRMILPASFLTTDGFVIIVPPIVQVASAKTIVTAWTGKTVIG